MNVSLDASSYEQAERRRDFRSALAAGLRNDPAIGSLIFANVVPGLVHEPVLHVFYGEKTVSVKDGLPKFKDLPKEAGGSGVELHE